jgi:hypothetical protein
VCFADSWISRNILPVFWHGVPLLFPLGVGCRFSGDGQLKDQQTDV